MNKELRCAFETEMARASQHYRAGRLSRAMPHLRNAHVLGQYHVGPHVRSHWAMLKVALRQRALGHAWGQLVRIVLGAAGSAVGKVSEGNTGDSEISMFARLPVDPGLAKLLPGPGKRP